MKKKVFIGLSGGVDSAVAAYLLSKDHLVIGVHIRNLEKDNFNNAKAVAEQLNIPFYIWDMRKEFEEEVINQFKKSLQQGFTPNPCIICNEKIKFGKFFEKCLNEGADYISTGHYARIENDNLLRGLDPAKDQSYFLYRLNKKILSKTLFPIGNMTKIGVKTIARKAGLKAAQSKESQDICFIENSNIRKYLQENLKEKPGNIIDFDTSEIVGTHMGVYFYTIGQREGIKVGGTEKPYYVINKDVKKDILFVGQGKDHKMLWKKEVQIIDESWIDDKPKTGKKYLCQIRYGQPPTPCKYVPGKVILDKSVYAPTQGQSVVLYDGSKVVGGGIICS